MTVANDGKNQLWAEAFGTHALSDIPQAFLDLFVDKSWKNDAAPTFQLQQNNACLLLSIISLDCNDPDLKNADRYTVQLCKQYEDKTINYDTPPILLVTTDDWEKLIETMSFFIDFNEE